MKGTIAATNDQFEGQMLQTNGKNKKNDTCRKEYSVLKIKFCA